MDTNGTKHDADGEYTTANGKAATGSTGSPQASRRGGYDGKRDARPTGRKRASKAGAAKKALFCETNPSSRDRKRVSMYLSDRELEIWTLRNFIGFVPPLGGVSEPNRVGRERIIEVKSGGFAGRLG